MAITKDCLSHWGGFYPGNRPPVAGEIVKVPEDMTYRVFDGKTWHAVDNEAMERLTAMDLRAIFANKNAVSDEFLELKYPDLAAMRECHQRERQKLEEEYNQLRDKYKVFEILKLDGDSNA